MVSAKALLARLEVFGTRLGLDRTRALLRRLDDPQSRLRVVLVAGTNGKGSTAALLSSMTTAAGYRTGLYTSPHLESVRERIRVDGVAIAEDDLTACLEEVLAAGEAEGREPPTYFEALTVAALLYFARAGVELAVLEVGLGGRLDATNATEPVLSLISEIGLDHQQHLGESLAEIAAEKAGIMRARRLTLAAVTASEARTALVERADDLAAVLRFVDQGAESEEPVLDRLTLQGAHQRANLRLALAGARALAEAGWDALDSAAMRLGVAGCRWPGRLEWVEVGGRDRVLLDGAHNPQAAAALATFLRHEMRSGYSLLFGALRDKRVDRMLPVLAEHAGRVLLTRLASPRSADPIELSALLTRNAPSLFESATAALGAALEEEAPVVACGSLYLVGEIRTELRRRFGRPPAAAEVRTAEPPTGDSR